MKDYSKLLKTDEKAVYDLRELYGRYGYRLFRTGKFEEYELYARNKDFLGNDGILTFTDTRGKLMALKPDVTLSIAKNSEDIPGVVQKFCYDDEVYRLKPGQDDFAEIRQSGIECIGDIDTYDVCEVISLAVQSLELIGADYVLDISHMGIVRGLISLLQLPPDGEERILSCIREKNVHECRSICASYEVSSVLTDLVCEMIATYGPMEEVLPKLGRFVVDQEMQKAAGELTVISGMLGAAGLLKNVRIDFSVVNDIGYYNGVIFQGFVKGLSQAVLSGGRYDPLMKKMGKKCGAIGFGVSLDRLEWLSDEKKSADVDVLLLYQKDADMKALGEAVRKLTDEGKSVLVEKKEPAGLRYKEKIEWKL